LAISTGGGD